MPHLRSRARLEDRIVMQRAQRKVLQREYEQAVADGRDTSLPLKQALTKPGDPRKLRGIPAQAKGVGGTIQDPSLRRILRDLDEWSPRERAA